MTLGRVSGPQRACAVAVPCEWRQRAAARPPIAGNCVGMCLVAMARLLLRMGMGLLRGGREP